MTGSAFQALLGEGAYIQVPVSIGSNSVSAGAVSSYTMTTTGNIRGGDLIIVVCSAETAAASVVASVSDGTNSYTQAVVRTSGSFTVSIWYKENAAAVASGATITVNLNTATTGSGNGLSVAAARATYIAASSSADKTAGNNGSGVNTITATSAALSQLNELAIGGAIDTAGTAYSGATGFTNLANFTVPGGNGWYAMDYSIPNSASAISYSPTFVTNGSVLAAVATFKGR